MRTRGIPIGTGWFIDKSKSGGGALIDRLIASVAVSLALAIYLYEVSAAHYGYFAARMALRLRRQLGQAAGRVEHTELLFCDRPEPAYQVTL